MRAFSSIFTLWLSVACSPEPRGDAWSADGQPFDTLTLPSVQVAPPGGPISLSVSPILLGRQATWTVTGLAPGERAYIGRSVAGVGPGPCPPVLGGLCLDLRGPVLLHATVTADAAGVATFSAFVPPTLPSGFSVSFQAAAAFGANSVKSQPVTVTVDEPVDTGGPSGLNSRPPNPTCLAAERPASNLSLDLTRVFPNVTLDLPTTLIQRPNDGSYWYVGELDGLIRRFENRNNATSAVVMDITARVLSGGELGLLGMAFDPDFATNGYLYVSYTGGNAGAPISRISRFTSTNGGLTFDPASEVVVFSLNQPFSNHNGGNIVFGPDGYLYAGFGDGGSANDPGNRAQNVNNKLGKFLRIDVQPNGTYTIPPDNPFANGGGAAEIYATGVRNPWRWSFDRATGVLWAGDVGQDNFEEIDIIERGKNYGWKVMEGTFCTNGPGCNDPAFTPPVYEYPHSGGSASVIGGYVYRGTSIPSLVGTYLFAEFYTGEVFGLVGDGAGGFSVSTVAQRNGMQTATFAEGLNGELYVADYQNRIWQITQSAPPAGPVFPQLLSETGCFDPADPNIPASGLIPYEPRSMLWSDNLDKSRWMALPDNTTITIGADGDWTFPIGSVLVKEFSHQGRKIETRLMMRHSDGGWGAYTYLWNPTGTEAVLAAAGAEVDLGGGQTWSVPTQAQCFSCHTPVAGDTLGLETAQLNSDLDYGGGAANQINTLDAIGMFAVSPGAPPSLPALPTLNGPASAELRSRSYLHANCSSCHRPGGGGLGGLDLLFDTPFADTNLCGVAPGDDLGVAGALNVLPGDASRSVLWLRMATTGGARMPALGTSVVHTEATDAVRDWINGLTACP